MKYKVATPVIHLTKEGYEKLGKELETLSIDRKDAVFHVAKAREMGDLSENGYYKSYKQKLGQIDSRIRRVRFLLRYGKIITNPKSDTIQIGSKVTLSQGETQIVYEIVGKEEADPRNGRISFVSPLGRLLMEKKVGDKVVLAGPKKTTEYTIEALS